MIFTQYGEPVEVVGVMLDLLGDDAAFFVWRKYINDSGEQGVNCAVFRNESKVLSSILIRQADAIAWTIWPGCRLYTYVDPKEVRGTNPGYCFLMAGWRKCPYMTKSGLLVFEHLPDGEPDNGNEEDHHTREKPNVLLSAGTDSSAVGSH